MEYIIHYRVLSTSYARKSLTGYSGMIYNSVILECFYILKPEMLN